MIAVNMRSETVLGARVTQLDSAAPTAVLNTRPSTRPAARSVASFITAPI
jgi:hypothetical protein